MRKLQLSQKSSGIFQSHCDTHKGIVPPQVHLSSADSPLLYLSHLQPSYLEICATYTHKDEKKSSFSWEAASLLSKQRMCQLGYCQLLMVFSSWSIFRKLSFLISHIQISGVCRRHGKSCQALLNTGTLCLLFAQLISLLDFILVFCKTFYLLNETEGRKMWLFLVSSVKKK